MATVIRGDDNWDTSLKAGSQAFAARCTSSSWATYSAGAIPAFNDDSTGDSFDDGNNYSTSTYKYTAPTTGVYMFWFSIYTAQNNVENGWSFLKNAGKLDLQHGTAKFITYMLNNADDKIMTATVVIPLSANDTMACCAGTTADFYKGYSQWGGCRLS